MQNAMILAAGRGARMGSLTTHTPKALLKVGDFFLIEYSIHYLIAAGFKEIIINVAHFKDKIIETIGTGQRYGINIHYSIENQALETGGGIVNALEFLTDPFTVMSADIITDFPSAKLLKYPETLAHLVLVPNPVFKPQGDFGLHQNYVNYSIKPFYTYGNIGVFRKSLFERTTPGIFPLSSILYPAIHNKTVTGEIYRGLWFNVGSPSELHAAQQQFS